ncbi:MAG: MFS transporter [Burkholderiaceae bacterium]
MSDATDSSPLAPFRTAAFRLLWPTWLIANLCMAMNDVAAAWMMTSLTVAPIWVALVQTASTLPVFLLGVPSGALADTLDRKRYFLVTQIWVAVVAAILSLVVMAGWMNPGLLLALTFANGIGLALRWPVFSAIVPEIVPRGHLPAALALNGVSMNASRIFGPLIAGILIASAGSAWVFLLNAVMSALSAFIVSRWKREVTVSHLARERLWSAMRVGLQYVGQSYHVKGVLLRIAVFFLHSTAITALLALVARQLTGGDAATFTILLAAMGAGAIAASGLLPRLRKRYTRDALVMRGIIVHAVGTAIVAWTDMTWLALVAMFMGGAAWITTANTLSVSLQLSLPDWVRARGMSTYQMAIMGASAAGAALWGQVATYTDISTSLYAASVSGVILMWLANRFMPDTGMIEDITPRRIFPAPQTDTPPPSGRILVSIEYEIAPKDADEFRRLMLDHSRRSRLQHGALQWELLHDLHQPERFTETFVDESWTDHLRRFDRTTEADVALRERKLALHKGSQPPIVRRHLMESTASAGFTAPPKSTATP